MSGAAERIGIGLIGFRDWGPYHARVFGQHPDCRLLVVAEREAPYLDAARQLVRGGEATSSYDDVLQHPGVQAVVIATPTDTHFSLVKAALLSGKDVLVERPITYTAAEAQKLLELADRHERVLMCSHIFLFNPGIRKLREYIQDGTLGPIYYMAATRTSLNPLRRDVNVLYDLGTDDVSIFHYLLGGRPREVMACGEYYLQRDVEDTVFGCLKFDNRTLCHLHVSWLNPRKQRTLVVVGEKRMAVWDDTVASEAVRLYDKGVVKEPSFDSFGQYQMALRDADVLIPRISTEEPLKLQDQHFLECVRTRQRPLSDGSFAWDVILSVEALQRSLRRGGSPQQPAVHREPRAGGDQAEGL
jgi:predicted dehydrogenase